MGKSKIGEFNHPSCCDKTVGTFQVAMVMNAAFVYESHPLDDIREQGGRKCLIEVYMLIQQHFLL